MTEDSVQSNFIQWIFGDERYFVRVNRYTSDASVLYYISCDHNEVQGEGFTIEEAMNMFIRNWQDYNESGP